MEWIELNGKNVHLILKNKYEYNGNIIAVEDRGNGLIFITLIDKFGKQVLFTSGEVIFLEVKA